MFFKMLILLFVLAVLLHLAYFSFAISVASLPVSSPIIYRFYRLYIPDSVMAY